MVLRGLHPNRNLNRNRNRNPEGRVPHGHSGHSGHSCPPPVIVVFRVTAVKNLHLAGPRFDTFPTSNS